MLILSLPGGEALAGQLAAELAVPHSPVAVHRFPDGEDLTRIDVPVEGRLVWLVADLHRPGDKTLPLLFTADAARDLGATRVGLVAPYLPYMRQDKRFRPGEAITSKTYARILSGTLDALVTVDPHLHRWTRLDQVYTLKSRVVAAAPAIARWIRREVREPVLVGPDSESAQWVRDVAARIGAPATVLAKVRRGDHDVEVQVADEALVRGRTPVLVDDIISTGRTLMAAARVLRGHGLAAPVCVGVHALFDAAAATCLAEAGVARVVTCDTVPHPSNAIGVAPLLAEAMQTFPW